MRINTNIASMNAQTNAANTNKNLSNSLEKLSSGLRINKAADDASGMAIADKLRTQASSIGQGISNANSGAALIQIADKALGEQSNILDTVKTKLIQASTSTTSAEGREAIRKDISKLLEQFDAISETTNYNGINLLNEKGADFNFQTGEYADSNISMELSRAVNTESLGASNGQVSSTVTGEMEFTTSISFNGDKDGGKITVDGTAADDQVTITSTGTNMHVAVTGNKVETIAANATGDITLKTDDAELIAKLDAIAATDATAGTNEFVRNGEGNYTISASTTLDFGDEGADLSNVELLTATASTQINIESVDGEDLTISKLGVDTSADITVDNTGVGNLKGTTDDMSKLSLTTGSAAGIALNSGVVSVKVGETSTAVASDRAVAINLSQASTTVEDTSFTVDAEEVTKLTLTGSSAAASVTLSSADDATLEKLEQAALVSERLTNNEDGTFTLTASGAGGDASITFDGGFDLANLQVDGLLSGTAPGGSEKLYIATQKAVTIDNTGGKEISLVATDMNAKATALGGLEGSEVSKTVVGEQLNNLKNLGEGELTADKAKSFMSSIDTALNQLNDVRADFGSTQSQVETAIRSMMVTQVNIKNAESVIRDTDYAAESANFNKQNIIAQAGTYAMSQANAMAQNVQRLLQ